MPSDLCCSQSIRMDAAAQLPDESERDALTLAELARRAARTGGPISGRASLTARGVGISRKITNVKDRKQLKSILNDL